MASRAELVAWSKDLMAVGMDGLTFPELQFRACGLAAATEAASCPRWKGFFSHVALNRALPIKERNFSGTCV
jgi:hypothetical protein